jgi:hypothetical protein
LRVDVKARYGIDLTAASPVWSWLIRHAGWLVARCFLKANGQTAYQDAYDCAYCNEIVPFAETVLYRIQKPSHRMLRDISGGTAEIHREALVSGLAAWRIQRRARSAHRGWPSDSSNDKTLGVEQACRSGSLEGCAGDTVESEDTGCTQTDTESPASGDAGF